ncbi:MAG TPA: hypothetical protein VJ875_00645 [Pyrinomonadaceae bacterium]|nr:hypothetical protein [Pyrinomonadaceae bacterium]
MPNENDANAPSENREKQLIEALNRIGEQLARLNNNLTSVSDDVRSILYILEQR